MRVRPWTSSARPSSAPAEVPVAVANGATPVATLTVNGPSTRIRSKPLTPKFRVAASAGAVSVASATAARTMRMAAPSPLMVKNVFKPAAANNISSRAIDVARSRLADRALGAAAQPDVPGPGDVDARRGGSVGGHLARSGDRHRRHFGDQRPGLDVARSGDFIIGDAGAAPAGVDPARAGNARLEPFDLDLAKAQLARPRDAGIETVAGDPVDCNGARPGD